MVFMWMFSIAHKSLHYFFTEKELNLRKRRWLEFLKDYDMSVHYHFYIQGAPLDVTGIVILEEDLE